MMSDDDLDPRRAPAQDPVPPTDAEVALWDDVFARNAVRRNYDDDQKRWACAWADYAVEQRRKRFGPR